MGRRLNKVVCLILFVTLFTPGTAAAASCPDVKFFGLHGTNELGPGEDTKFSGVGRTVWNIWGKFVESNAKPVSKSFEAVDFPESVVDDLKNPDPVAVGVFLAQVAKLDPAADVAAAQLVSRDSDFFTLV